MRHFPSDKYNLAWFKLAECVSRGEKERALGVYRLLAHSLPDAAFALQLEGDLLLAFNDDLASKKYQGAIALYTKQDRLQEAIAVNEHLITLNPASSADLLSIIALYKKLAIFDKVQQYVHQLLQLIIKRNDYALLEQLLQEYRVELPSDNFIPIAKTVVLALVMKNNVPKVCIQVWLQAVLGSLIAHENSGLLQQFLSELELHNEFYYQEACKYLE